MRSRNTTPFDDTEQYNVVSGSTLFSFLFFIPVGITGCHGRPVTEMAWSREGPFSSWPDYSDVKQCTVAIRRVTGASVAFAKQTGATPNL